MAIPSLKSYSGGKNLDTTETQTGDAETQLQSIDLPSSDGVYNVIGIVGVSKKDAADEYAAIKRFDKSFRKAGGSIQEVVDHSDSESFSDLVGGLFSDGDLTLKDGASGFGLYGDSPQTFNQTESVNTTRDQSTISNLPTLESRAACDTDPDDGSIHYVYDDGSELKYYPPGGPAETVSTKRVDNIDAKIDMHVSDNGDVHVAWVGDPAFDLFYNVRSGESWGSDETVDSPGDVGAVNIKTDSSDVPHTAYSDAANDKLKYANRTGGSWSAEDVDTGIRVPTVRMHLESSTNIGIIYEDATNGQTKFAEGESGSFSTAVVDASVSCSGCDVDWRTSDWLVGYIDPANDELYEGVGDVSGGFTTSNFGSADAENQTSILVFSENFDAIVVQGDSAGSNPFDAELYTDESGSWSLSEILATLGADWSSHKNENYITVTDNGNGDSTLVSIQMATATTITLEWRTGAEVTNA
jgi:hypothetical protein